MNALEYIIVPVFVVSAFSASAVMQIFKVFFGGRNSQSSVSLNQFKKLRERADKAIKACSDKASMGDKKLSVARSALK